MVQWTFCGFICFEICIKYIVFSSVISFMYPIKSMYFWWYTIFFYVIPICRLNLTIKNLNIRELHCMQLELLCLHFQIESNFSADTHSRCVLSNGHSLSRKFFYVWDNEKGKPIQLLSQNSKFSTIKFWFQIFQNGCVCKSGVQHCMNLKNPLANFMCSKSNNKC